MNYFIFFFLGGAMMSGAALYEASVLLAAYREGEIQYGHLGATLNRFDEPKEFMRELRKLTAIIFAYLTAGLALIVIGVLG